jgi:hypothetical protein
MVFDNKKVCIISGFFPLTGAYHVSRNARIDETGKAVIIHFLPAHYPG